MDLEELRLKILKEEIKETFVVGLFSITPIFDFFEDEYMGEDTSFEYLKGIEVVFIPK